MIYQCSICKLHYANKHDAEKCYAWCSINNSCNLEVSKKSIEAIRSRNKIKN